MPDELAWLTYREAADQLGTTRDAAAVRARRLGWPRRPGNKPTAPAVVEHQIDALRALKAQRQVGELRQQLEAARVFGAEQRVLADGLATERRSARRRTGSNPPPLVAVLAMISPARSLIAGLGLSLAMLASQPASSETVQLEQLHGLFMVPVRINDKIEIPFILDSGASVVVITADVFSVLQRTGTISQADFKGTGTSILADGSEISSDFYVLHKMVVGNRVITDVVASISPAKGDPLLGQSFLSKLPAWTVDNERHVLVFGAPPLNNASNQSNPFDQFDAAPAAKPPPPPPPGVTPFGLPPPPPGFRVVQPIEPTQPPSPGSAAPNFDPSKPYTGSKNYADGAHYEGAFLYGKRNGHGVFTLSNGARQEGQFRNDKLIHGVVTFSNGARQEGQFRDDKLNGHGAIITNGIRWEGEYRRDKLNGHGVVTFSSGTRQEGQFRNDKLIHGVVTILGRAPYVCDGASCP